MSVRRPRLWLRRLWRSWTTEDMSGGQRGSRWNDGRSLCGHGATSLPRAADGARARAFRGERVRPVQGRLERVSGRRARPERRSIGYVVGGVFRYTVRCNAVTAFCFLRGIIFFFFLIFRRK